MTLVDPNKFSKGAFRVKETGSELRAICFQGNHCEQAKYHHTTKFFDV